MVILAFTLIALLLRLFSKGQFSEEKAYISGKNRNIRPPVILLLKWNATVVGLKALSIFRHRYASGYERKIESTYCRLEERDPHAAMRAHIAAVTMGLYVTAAFASYAAASGRASQELFIGCVIFAILIIYLPGKNLENKVMKMREDMQRDFPVFLNKLVIMLNAGLTVSGAMARIVREGEKGSRLYCELNRTSNEIASGKSEIQSYEDFAMRCRMNEISMFTSILVQNIRKGNRELAGILRLQAASCWENRKNAARKLGEEASAKLLLPMMMVFAAILIMVMAPAIMQMNIF